MNISRTTFYRDPEENDAQLKNDLVLRDLILDVHKELPGYGYRSLRNHFLRSGLRINAKRIRRVMKKFKIFTTSKPMFKPRGAALGKRLVFANLIQGLELNGPNQLWSTDFTYLRLLKEFAYLSVVLDVYTRKVVGWAISRELDHRFCLQAIEVAVNSYKPAHGAVFHSDRGVQYTCEKTIDYLKANGFKISMSRAATPTDNAHVESFFKTLKRDEVYVYEYETIDDVINHLPSFIDCIYNEKRLHSSLGYKTPAEFEAEILQLKPADRPVQKLAGKAV